PGAKNKNGGKPLRHSKRRHNTKFEYRDQGNVSAKRAAKEAKRLKRKYAHAKHAAAGAAGSGRSSTRKRTAGSRQRAKHTKDLRRAKAIALKREQRATLAAQMRDSLSSVALATLTIGQLKQLALAAFYAGLAQAWP